MIGLLFYLMSAEQDAVPPLPSSTLTLTAYEPTAALAELQRASGPCPLRNRRWPYSCRTANRCRVAGVYVHRHSAARTGIDRCRVHGAGRYRRMIRGRQRIRNPEAQHEAGRRTEIVLAPTRAHRGTRVGCHQVIELREAPRDVLRQHDVHAAARGDCKGMLIHSRQFDPPCMPPARNSANGTKWSNFRKFSRGPKR